MRRGGKALSSCGGSGSGIGKADLDAGGAAESAFPNSKMMSLAGLCHAPFQLSEGSACRYGEKPRLAVLGRVSAQGVRVRGPFGCVAGSVWQRMEREE